jgi:hypothetical protein
VSASAATLPSAVADRSAVVGVIGLGYEAGFDHKVIGVGTRVAAYGEAAEPK